MRLQTRKVVLLRQNLTCSSKRATRSSVYSTVQELCESRGKYFCLLHGPTVILLMNCYIRNKFCLNQSRGGRPGPPVPNSPYGLCGHKATLNLNSVCRCKTAELGSCVKVEVAVLGSPFLTDLTVSVDVKQH